MGSRTTLSLPSLVAAADGHGPLECVAAACEDALASHGAGVRAEIEHVMLAGGAGSGRDIAALLPRRLGLPDRVTCSLAAGESGAAGLAVLRMADACCRGRASARVLIASVGCAGREIAPLPPASAVIASGPEHAPQGLSVRLDRLATWSHRPDSGEMTLSQAGDRFDLEPSTYLGGDDVLDLAAFLRDHLDISRARAARCSWAIHAPSLEDARAGLTLSDDRLAFSRGALALHGPRATSGVWEALRAAISSAVEDDGEIVALGIGPGPTVEAARFTRLPARD